MAALVAQPLALLPEPPAALPAAVGDGGAGEGVPEAAAALSEGEREAALKKGALPVAEESDEQIMFSCNICYDVSGGGARGGAGAARAQSGSSNQQQEHAP